MQNAFRVSPHDRDIYAGQLRSFLPERIVDLHAHVWKKQFKTESNADDPRTVSWPFVVAPDNPIEDLQETYRLLLPDKRVRTLFFSSLRRNDDFERANDYVAHWARHTGDSALLYTPPYWSAAEFRARLQSGGFVGSKVYLSLADPAIPREKVTIFDFAPPHLLEVLDERGLLLMLHIPRSGRLGDQANLEQLEALDRSYENLKVVVAHAGRVYCPEHAGEGFGVMARTKRLLFDISANASDWAFERLLESVGPERVLFGTDLPYVRLRTRRICENGNYVNLVPRGEYESLADDRHIREVDGADSDFTFLLYEEILAFKRAAEQVGLTGSEIGAVFYDNGARLLDSIRT